MKTDTTLPSRDLQSWNRQKTNAHTDNHRLRPEIIRNRIGTVLVHTGESWKGPSRPAGMYQVTLGRGFPRRQTGMCKGPKVSLWLGTTILPWHRPWGRKIPRAMWRGQKTKSKTMTNTQNYRQYQAQGKSWVSYYWGFPVGSGIKNPSATGSGGGYGHPRQYSCLGNPMDRGAWQAIVQGVTKESDTTEQLNHNLIIPINLKGSILALSTQQVLNKWALSSKAQVHDLRVFLLVFFLIDLKN